MYSESVIAWYVWTRWQTSTYTNSHVDSKFV